MRYYVFHVEGEVAKEYLCGANLIGVWEENYNKAYQTVSGYFEEGVSITLVSGEAGSSLLDYLKTEKEV